VKFIWNNSYKLIYNSCISFFTFSFNLVDITKLPCYPHRRSTTVSLETFTIYSLVPRMSHLTPPPPPPYLLGAREQRGSGSGSIQWISVNKTSHAIRWIVIYPVDSIIHLLNNPALVFKDF